MGKFEYKYKRDLIGEKFGRLMVIGEVRKEEWKSKNFIENICKCDCGNVIHIRRNNLLSGATLSCGCLRKSNASRLVVSRQKGDLIGKRFGRLVVCSETDKSEWRNKGKREYICKCDCGKTINVKRNALVSGNTKSCGCMHNDTVKNQFEDLTGKTFGELTAIKRAESVYTKSGQPITRWLFRCSCGREVIIRVCNVKTGATKSCGHIGKSIAEYEITKYLSDHNIRFDLQASFYDLKNPETNRRLKYDFKIYRNDGSYFIIEHHGIQHFVFRDDEFGKLQREKTDKMKRDYCKTKGITLYETLYSEDYISKLQRIIEKELGKDDAYEKGVKCG